MRSKHTHVLAIFCYLLAIVASINLVILTENHLRMWNILTDFEL